MKPQVPAGSNVTVPSQRRQVPVQAFSQHTPSTQWPLWHWAAAVHESPLACVGPHTPPGRHTLPEEQSAFTAQLDLQVVAPHA
jgi:hypothetical protein